MLFNSIKNNQYGKIFTKTSTHITIVINYYLCVSIA
jgi:hypothetical protein